MKHNIIAAIKSSMNKSTFKIQKHSPELLIFVGITGIVGSAIAACCATTKLGDILDDSKSTLDSIDKVATEEPERYTEKEAKKAKALVYAQTTGKIVKLYAPSVIIGSLSLVSVVSSNNILRKRNVALTAAYTTLDKSFKAYRGRVIERFGKAVDYELKHNVQKKEVEEKVVDKDGNETTVKKTIPYVDPNDVSMYARFFDEYTRDEKGNVVKNHNWNRSPEYNLMFLKTTQTYANDLLRANGRLFLNDVYKMLGFPITKAGQIVGWVYDENNPDGDNYIDFGLYSHSDNYNDFAFGNEPILLDFNVDGNVWEMMK